ncbi:MAG: hypothetical protein ACFFCW_26450, partial [Candidatus Hodarchaeota archaeon]
LQGEIEAYRFIDKHLSFRYNKLVKFYVSLRHLSIAEAYKQSGHRINALTNLFKCISNSPFNQCTSSRYLFLMLLELALPGVYRILKGLKNRYLNSSELM